ncbi:hypothetical protein GGD65_000369 [Bradyrhizobium sp. CIR18]|uniref:hypothetical protein n=1 Tax=Bradyrhizobium sp. CIR18 TaxID=2663839 RepID=UPI001606CC47|nr:hypothetical protein [Bradyrhizobium sp. CIR18]MBB4359371.1 hypothetical protein [Bradyrhizobium sp. CIR18]
MGYLDGYFEKWSSGGFKTTEDGRRLFFPWGPNRRGYSIASEEDYQRLREQMKAYQIAAMITTFFAILVLYYVAGYVLWTLIVAGLICSLINLTSYRVWMWRLLPRLQATEEQLSRQESMTSLARAYGEEALWRLQFGSIAMAGLSALLLFGEPASKILALVGIAFFGFCAIVFRRMVMLEQQSRAQQG